MNESAIAVNAPLASAHELPARVLHAFTHPRRRPATADEALALSEASRMDIAHGEQTLALWRWGEGPTVLLVHGWESRASHLASFVPGLLEAGFSVLALDAPAHGASSGVSTDVVDHGRAVLAAAAASHEPVVGLIAHSVGSAAALYAYSQGLRVQASVHIAGPASLQRVLWGMGQAAGLDAEGQGRLATLMRERLRAPLGIMELTALQATLQHPALILHDPDDPEMPFSESQALAAAWPRAQLLALAGLGHRRMLRDPKAVATAVRFIAQSTQTSAPSLAMGGAA